MAGHSKWANIKRHKAKQDAKRGKLYTKIIREVTVAARLGGADAQSNSRLRAALDKAQEANMTKEVLDRAIKRGVGGMEGEEVEEIRYEGYGPGGIAVMVDCMTNNRNRTVGEVRHVFSKNNGNLGTDGSVAYLFKQQGQMIFVGELNEERLIELALEVDAEDVITHADNSIEVITTAENFLNVKTAFINAQFHPQEAELTMRAATPIVVQDKETAEKVINLIDALEDLDDVQLVYSNVEIAEDILSDM
jgi:YebC/PmpR family DNA-binding regulatory protein